MKLQYLAQVQTLLEEYDFQDKYKVLLELEESISRLEVGGKVDHNLLMSELGTPAQFVNGLIGTYDLSKITDPSLIDSAIDNTADLLDATKELNSANVQARMHANTSLDNDEQNTIDIEPLEDMTKTKNSSNQKSTDDNDEDHVDYARDDHDSNSKSKSKSSSKSDSKKLPVKIIFGIIMAIFYFIAFLGLAFTIVLSIGLLVFIDVQTAISLFLGILFLLLTIGLSLSFIKTAIYSIIDLEMKTFKLGIRFIFIIVFAFLSKIMLSSSLETVGLYVTQNLSTIQNLFAGYNIDVTNIDWQNLDFGEYVKLFGNMIKSVF